MLNIAITIRKKEDQDVFFMKNTYYKFLCPYFNIELVLPRQDRNYQDIVKRNDALLICGGYDIDPVLFNQEINDFTHKEDQEIENMDIDLFHQFYQQNKHIIGICRGIQVINVLLKGTLYQDIPTLYSTDIHHDHEDHLIYPIINTFFSTYIKKPIVVNSFHHQNIKDLSPMLKANAISCDGLIEGVESHRILAFQWHPERMNSELQSTFIQMICDFINR